MPALIRWTIRAILLTTALSIAAACRLHAQSLDVYDLDLSNFPEVSGRLVALDASGEPIDGLSQDDISVTENGNPVPSILDLNCPPTTVDEPLSVVLVNDRSGSMNSDIRPGQTRLELLKRGTIAFVDLFRFTPPGAVAVTAFDESPFIVSDFQVSAPPLITAIDGLTADGGTQYTPAFLDGLVGGISLLKTRPASVRRILVFLTDGEPNSPPAIDSIISEATREKVEIHVITIGLKITSDLKRLAEATGGTWHGDISSESEMEGIYRQIALTSRGMKPCRISWYSDRSCGFADAIRNVRVTVASHAISADVRYVVPPSGIVRLESEPGFVWFGETAPPATVDKQVTITARGGTFSVTEGTITSGKPYEVVDWGGTPPPFDLSDGASRTLTLRFTPPDTSVFTASLRLTSTPCAPPDIVLTGGVRDASGASPLQLITPNGGESYSGCDTVLIRWAGVSPEDTATIEYSGDNGESWTTITDKATGLIYPWLPPSPGTNYRIRISTKGDPATTIDRVAGGGLGGDNGPARAASLVVPAGLAVENGMLYIAESGGNRIRRVDLATGTITTVAGTGSPGNLGDGGQATQAKLYNPNDVVVSGDRMYIADYANNLIREVNLTTGIITTIAGTGESGFSGDSGLAINAKIREPGYLALGPGALYVADRNYRIRKIDLATGIITTIAGAGLNEGDGGPAYRAFLSVPTGMSVQGESLYVAENGSHRIRRIDLQSGLITTVAGTGYYGSIGDGGPATLARLYGPTGVDAIGNYLYITDSDNNRIRRVDLTSGIITNVAGSGALGNQNNDGDGGPPGSAKMNYPVAPIVADGKLYFSDMRNDLVRAVTLGRQPGLATSQSTFTVAAGRLTVSPDIALKTIDMGTMAAGEYRDSTVTLAICNTGSAPLILESAAITGTNADDFAITSGTSAAAIPPGGCRDIEVRYQPSTLGQHTAQLVLTGACASADTIRLVGNAVAPCGYTALDIADLGAVEVDGGTLDTTLTASICNFGANTIAGNARITTPGNAFTIVQGGGPFSIASGECHDVLIHFDPSAVGRVTAELDYGIPTYCGPAETILLGRGVTTQTLATVASIAFPATGCATEPVDTTLVIRNTGGLPLEISDARIVSNNEGFSLLPPLPSVSSPITIAPNRIDSLRIRFAPASSGVKSAILEIVSNSPDSPSRIPLSGRRDSSRVAATDLVLSFGSPTLPTAFPRDTFVVVENTGAMSIEIVDGTVAGRDASKFEIPAGQFPVEIAPGGSAHIAVRALERSADSSWQAVLQLDRSPACDSGVVDVQLVVPGARPTLFATEPNFNHLFCPNDHLDEQRITIRNDGGADLRIDRYEIRNDPDGNFALSMTLPIVIHPGDDTVVTVRFAPVSPGPKEAELIFHSNAEAAETTVRLTGLRDSIAFETSTREIDFGIRAIGTTADTTITVTNTGTFQIYWDVPTTIGPFSVVAADPSVAGPGETSKITIRFTADAQGVDSDTLHFREIVCGTSTPILLSGIAGEVVTTVVTLPNDTGRVGRPIALPIRLSIADRDAFARVGADSFRTSIRYSGNILRLDTVMNATVVAREEDRLSGDVTLTLEGTYPDTENDTLAYLVCTPMFGDRTVTPLIFTSYRWDKPNARADTVNGSFALTGNCYETGLVLMAEPKVLKIRPQPASGTAQIDLELDDWMDLRALLIDEHGAMVAESALGRYEAGRHTVGIDLAGVPSGVYSLVIETPFGRVARPIIVTR